MVALRGAAIDGFLKRPDPAQPIILLFGPDAGLVRERADALVASAVDDPSDPFALVRMDGDELSSEPSRLVEEALTIPLFGGRRAIRVRAGSRSFASGVETLTTVTIKDCRIVIEAGDLKPDAALRKICEKAKTAAAIPCYVDGARDIARLIDEELRGAGLTIAADAEAALVALLGGDRQASRNELRKLALYAHGAGQVTLHDIDAVVADASDLKIDPILDGAFAGRPAAVEAAFTKALAAGTNTGQILMMAQRHAASLHKASLAMHDGQGGQGAAQAAESGFPRLHFSRKSAVEAALKNLSSARLAAAFEQLGQAARDARINTVLAQDIAQRALMAIAANARRRS